MRKLGLRAKAAVARIKLFDGRLDHLLDERQAKMAATTGEVLALRNGIHHARCGFEHIIAPRLPGIGHGYQHSLEAGTTVAIVAGKIGASEEGAAIGREHGSERPSTLPAYGGDGGLVAAVDIGTFVAVDFDGNEMLIDYTGQACILIGLAVHDVAPVAPYGADVEQDRLVLGGGEVEGCVAPLVPANGLMHRGAQIGGCGILQSIQRGVLASLSRFWITHIGSLSAKRRRRNRVSRGLRIHCEGRAP